MQYNKPSEILTEHINKGITVLQEGGLILYPTDIGWAIGCDATQENPVQNLLRLLNTSSNSYIECLVANDAMLERHVENVPDLAYDLMDLSTKPVTIVYDNPKAIAASVLDENGCFAVRVATDKFCRYLINKFKKPIVATTANSKGNRVPKSFKEIETAILKGVDYVVNLQQENEGSQLTTIIKLGSDHKVKVVRE